MQYDPVKDRFGRLVEGRPLLMRPFFAALQLIFLRAWYVRVPDLPAFLMDVAAQLEENLADSVFAGHTGAIDVNTYREGYRLRLEQGRLVEVSSWQGTLALTLKKTFLGVKA